MIWYVQPMVENTHFHTQNEKKERGKNNLDWMKLLKGAIIKTLLQMTLVIALKCARVHTFDILKCQLKYKLMRTGLISISC